MIDFTRLNLNNKEPVYVQIASFVKKQILAGPRNQAKSFRQERACRIAESILILFRKRTAHGRREAM